MNGLASEPAAEPRRLTELRRGAKLGLLWLEIEAIRLRLEIEAVWRDPEAGPDVEEDTEEAWVVRIDPAQWKKPLNAAGRLPRRRVFRLTTGRAAIRPRRFNDTEAMLAVARELVNLLEAERNARTVAA